MLELRKFPTSVCRPKWLCHGLLSTIMALGSTVAVNSLLISRKAGCQRDPSVMYADVFLNVNGDIQRTVREGKGSDDEEMQIISSSVNYQCSGREDEGTFHVSRLSTSSPFLLPRHGLLGTKFNICTASVASGKSRIYQACLEPSIEGQPFYLRCSFVPITVASGYGCLQHE